MRPYSDAEVPAVIARLRRNVELRDGIASFLFPRLYRVSAGATRWLTAGLLWYRARELNTVHDVQMMVRRFIDHMVQASVDGLSWNGLQQLNPDTPYLFISNHRDIALDSAFLNRVLHEEGFPTCQIAVGDNLFGTPHADDLMRLNRGFLVERSAGGPKAAYGALRRTSGYVRGSLEAGTSVWIAQREGRAKDGFDRTDPALLKMLALAWRSAEHKSEPARLAQLVQGVQLVPVAISYELDPCDLRKAEELWQTAAKGSFSKAQGADLASIVEGVRGYKGRVHLSFSQPICGDFESAEALARAMDEAIVGGLQVYPPNLCALHTLREGGEEAGEQADEVGEQFGSAVLSVQSTATQTSEALSFFEARVASTTAAERPYLLLQYANLLRNRAELGLAGDVQISSR